MATAPIVLDVGGAVKATSAGAFIFRVDAGDTSVAHWSVESQHTSLDLVKVSIDLTTTLSLFDDGSTPTTDVSGPGVPGVSNIAGNVPVGSAEDNLWSNAANKGDMYTAEHAEWGGFATTGLTFGQVSTWLDDTDLIPEPTSAGAIAASLFIRRRRR